MSKELPKPPWSKSTAPNFHRHHTLGRDVQPVTPRNATYDMTTIKYRTLLVPC